MESLQKAPSHKGRIASPSKQESGEQTTEVRDVEKLADIAEILEMMEESNKTKDWLIEQIRLKHQRVALRSTMSTVGILKVCPHEFILHLLASMQSNNLDEFEGPPPLTQTYHWFFTDIVAGSDPSLTANEQARKIIVLNKLIERTDVFKQRDPDTTLILPTGDGMAMGFRETPEKPLNLALEVHKGLGRYNTQTTEKNRIYLRIGLESGPVYIIKDLKGNENVWGPGIIMARRVMDLAGDMNILASASFANSVRMLRPEYKHILHPIGDYQIKHGEKLLIYNVYGPDFGSKKSPKDSKKQQSKAAEEVQKTSSRFLFEYSAVELDVRDIRTMMTHHTLIWNLINISNEPVERIFYYLDGDTPKQFQDLNVSVKDEEDRELEIMSLNVNKPYRKEFFVKARRPMKPGEKGRIFKCEFDWEEPEKKYFYRFAADCKKFNFLLTVPKGIEVNQKVVKVDSEIGEKTYASTPATVKYLPERTEVTWSTTNVKTFEGYRFDW